MNSLIKILTLSLLTGLAAQAASADTSVQKKHNKRPLVLNLALHDELSAKEVADLTPTYLSWFIEDLSSITGRDVQIVWIKNKPGYTDINYRLGDAEKTMLEWDNRVADLVLSERLDRSKLNKFVLITRHDPAPDVYGKAYLGKRSAIASLTQKRTIAHEVGHLLSATHDDGQLLPGGFPFTCLSNMKAHEYFFIENCYRYSGKTAQVIRSHLEDMP